MNYQITLVRREPGGRNDHRGDNFLSVGREMIRGFTLKEACSPLVDHSSFLNTESLKKFNPLKEYGVMNLFFATC